MENVKSIQPADPTHITFQFLQSLYQFD